MRAEFVKFITSFGCAKVVKIGLTCTSMLRELHRPLGCAKVVKIGLTCTSMLRELHRPLKRTLLSNFITKFR